MNEKFNTDFKLLYERYILKYSISDEAIKSLIINIFYTTRKPLEKVYDDLDSEVVYLMKLLEEYTVDRKKALRIYKRLCNCYGWDLDYYESTYKGERLEYIYQRDSHISIILFLLNCYTLVHNDIVDTNSSAFFLRHAMRIEAQLNIDGLGFGNKLFLNFTNYIVNIIESVELTKPRKSNLLRVIAQYNS